MADLLTTMKERLRLTSSDFDDEITSLVQAGKADLASAGVKDIKDEDPRIVQALSLYLKAFFGSENPEMLKYEKLYEKLKLNLCYKPSSESEV